MGLISKAIACDTVETVGTIGCGSELFCVRRVSRVHDLWSKLGPHRVRRGFLQTFSFVQVLYSRQFLSIETLTEGDHSFTNQVVCCCFLVKILLVLFF